MRTTLARCALALCVVVSTLVAEAPPDNAAPPAEKEARAQLYEALKRYVTNCPDTELAGECLSLLNVVAKEQEGPQKAAELLRSLADLPKAPDSFKAMALMECLGIYAEANDLEKAKAVGAMIVKLEPEFQEMVKEQLAQIGKSLAANAMVGKPAKPLKGKDLEGKDVNLADYKGKVVVIDFWATWCGPCIKAMPEMKKLHEELGPKGLVLIGVSLDQGKTALTDYLKKEAIPWRQIFSGKPGNDPDAQAYAVDGIPTTVVIDREGVVTFRGHPAGGLRGKIEDALAKEPAKAEK